MSEHRQEALSHADCGSGDGFVFYYTPIHFAPFGVIVEGCFLFCEGLPMLSPYDVALVCLNGHVVNSHSASQPEYNTKYCKDCGASTIDRCPICFAKLPGSDDWKSLQIPPSYCHECGKPYPWTLSNIEAAIEMIDLLDGIDEADRQKLKDSLPDIARQTPKSDVAVKRWQMIAKKAGGEAYKLLIKVASDLASEYTKKLLIGP